MSTGVVISAPAVVLSVMIGADVATICILLAVPTAIYTMYGGVQAVAWTDVKQMYLIVGGLLAAVVALILGLPDTVSVGEALHIAGTAGKLQAFNFSTDPTVRFTFWTGTIGALFLFLSYFGTDQSQVQRYLTAKSVDEARTSLFMSAYWKIPLQALVMIIGVLMFVFYLFTPPPMLFNNVHDERVRESARSAEYVALEQKFQAAVDERREAARQLAGAERSADAGGHRREQDRVHRCRAERQGRARRGDRARQGRVGRLDLQRRQLRVPDLHRHAAAGRPGRLADGGHLRRGDVDDRRRAVGALDVNGDRLLPALGSRRRRREHTCCWVSKVAMLFWAVFASIVAIWAAELGSLIEVVNRFGSFFYGSILGVFLLAIGWSRANSTGAFVGLIAGMSVVGWVSINTQIAFLWYNLIGAVVVFGVGMIVSALTGGRDQGSGIRGSGVNGPSATRRAAACARVDGGVVDARRVPEAA